MGPREFAERARQIDPTIAVLELAASTATAQAAAAALGCEVAQICKSLVFECDGQAVLVLTRGDRRVDLDRLCAAVGAERARRASVDLVREATGYSIGGVPPFCHARRLRTVYDTCLSEFAVVHAAAGGPNALFGVRTDRLQELAQAQAACVCARTD